jgi:hypothetical protein
MIRRISIVLLVAMFVLSLVAIPLSHFSPAVRVGGGGSVDDATFDGWSGAKLAPGWRITGCYARIAVGHEWRLFLAVAGGEFKVALALTDDPYLHLFQPSNLLNLRLARVGTWHPERCSVVATPSRITQSLGVSAEVGLYDAAIRLWLVAVVTGLGGFTSRYRFSKSE